MLQWPLHHADDFILAESLTESERNPETYEQDMEVLRLPFAEAFEAALSGQIAHSGSVTALSRSELDAALSGEHEHRAASAVELVADLSGGVSEEPCKAGRKDQLCLRELRAESIKKMLLSARSEATPEP